MWVRLSTFDSTYAEDEKERHTKFYFTLDDQRKIIQLADSFFFWEMPDTLPEDKNIIALPCPGTTIIHIKMKEHDKTVRFNCTFEKDSERINIRSLRSAIFDIFYKKPEYLSLPPRRFFHQ